MTTCRELVGRADALQAMHDLLVWFLCHGWTDCDCVLEFVENAE